jgi:ribosomal protein S18 acetylase RimI-like enzyme
MTIDSGGGYTLRPVEEEDGEFLVGLYGSTREEELARVPWTTEQKDAFIRMQFHAQTTYYAQVYPQMEYVVIMCNRTRAGRLILAELDDEIRIVDICLLPAFRRAGIGTGLIGQVFDRARRGHKAVRIDVEVFNPAKKLYDRLGFTLKTTSEIYLQMEWMPGIEEARTSEGARAV